MIIDVKHKLFDKVILLDITGKHIKNTVSFDTETNDTELLLMTGDGYIVVTDGSLKSRTVPRVTVNLPGAKLIYKDTRKRVEC